MFMLYRAFVDCTAPGWRAEEPKSPYGTQRTVFFDARSREEAAPKLTRLLAVLWEVQEDSIEIENLCDEKELAENAAWQTTNPNHYLFETGWGNGMPHYDGWLNHPLFLSEINNRRLMDTYQSLPYCGEAPVTVVKHDDKEH